jgi:hypothetical protein
MSTDLNNYCITKKRRHGRKETRNEHGGSPAGRTPVPYPHLTPRPSSVPTRVARLPPLRLRDPAQTLPAQTERIFLLPPGSNAQARPRPCPRPPCPLRSRLRRRPGQHSSPALRRFPIPDFKCLASYISRVVSLSSRQVVDGAAENGTGAGRLDRRTRVSERAVPRLVSVQT